MGVETREWRGDDLPEFCGPEHLARAVAAQRSFDVAEESEGRISREGLTRIVELAYRVSLTTEEGRHPRFVVFVPAPAAESHLAHVARFDPPVTINARSLQHLVPSIPAGRHALCIREAGDELLATGVTLLRDPSSVPRPGRPAVSFGMGLPGFTLRIEGPGQARATERALTFELSAGHVRPVAHVSVLPPVQRWLDGLSLALVADVRASCGDEEAREREALGDAALVFDSVVATMLASTIAAAHGGAFVVLPDADEECLSVTYRASALDLYRDVVAYWRACFDSSRVDDAAILEQRAMHWEAARRWVTSSARAVADLSNVDGCVVLDPRLRVLGFGAEIRVAEADVATATLEEVDAHTGAALGDVDLARFGTRHRSAFRLCARRPGALAFVISADRELRVFHGSRKHPGRVRLWQALGAWMSSWD